MCPRMKNAALKSARRMCERRGTDVSDTKVFKREAEIEEKRMYTDMRNSRDVFGREDIMEEARMGVKTAEKVLICGDEVGEKSYLPARRRPG